MRATVFEDFGCLLVESKRDLRIELVLAAKKVQMPDNLVVGKNEAHQEYRVRNEIRRGGLVSTILNHR